MFKEMVLYHAILIYLTIGVLILGLLIPFLSRTQERVIKRMRIYMFFIHSFFTMVAFSGLVAFVFAKMSFDITILIMILVYIIISILESIKYLKILKYQDISQTRATAIVYTIINILLMVTLIIWEIKEHTHEVSII